jgi:hypothetical protein
MVCRVCRFAWSAGVSRLAGFEGLGKDLTIVFSPKNVLKGTRSV